jgi:hypothetical protein
MASFSLEKFEFNLNLLRDFSAARIPTLTDRAIRRVQIEAMGVDRARAHLTTGLEMDHRDFCLIRALMQKSRAGEGAGSMVVSGYGSTSRAAMECAV